MEDSLPAETTEKIYSQWTLPSPIWLCSRAEQSLIDAIQNLRRVLKGEAAVEGQPARDMKKSTMATPAQPRPGPYRTLFNSHVGDPRSLSRESDCRSWMQRVWLFMPWPRAGPVVFVRDLLHADRRLGSGGGGGAPRGNPAGQAERDVATFDVAKLITQIFSPMPRNGWKA